LAELISGESVFFAQYTYQSKLTIFLTGQVFQHATKHLTGQMTETTGANSTIIINLKDCVVYC